MMSRFFVLIGLTVLPFCMKSQEPVEYEQMLEIVSNPESDQFYPTLLERFKKGDKELTLDDYRALYYGFTFQDNYRPYDRDPRDFEISNLIASGMDEVTTPKLIEISRDYLNDNPFSLKILNYLQNFLAQIDDTTEIDLIQTQYDGILNAIKSSGDGQTEETGFSVNHPSDEYMLLRSFKLKPSSNRFETTYDYFDLEENELGIEGIYFDVYQMVKVGSKQLGIETVVIENEELPENGVLIGSRDEILSYVPLGFQVLDELNVDFDNDGDLDWILVFNKEGEEQLSNSAAGDPELRILTLLERKEDKSLQELISSNSTIPCIDCGEGSAEDPFKGIHFENGILQVKSAGGSLFQWERTISFEYNNGFFLSQEAFTSFRKGKKDQAQVDIETKDDFGVISLSDYDYQNFLQ